MDAWVDFKAVKKQVTMRMALSHYKVDWLRKKGSELHGRCPIHKGKSADSFHVDTEKDCFNCFAAKCGKHGNVLDFVAAMEDCSVRDAALKLQEWFQLDAPTAAKTEAQKTSELARKEDQAAGSGGEAVTENTPLKFELKGVDPNHVYVRDRGITLPVAELFGIGLFAGKGVMSGRVVIPIHNQHGQLLAYAGRRLVDPPEDGDEDNEPRYRLPPGFHKSLELFNLHRAVEKIRSGTVVLVEGFFGCMKVWQAGFPCVALMGSSMSGQQEQLLRNHFTGVLLVFDGDQSGQKCMDECLLRLGRGMWVKAIELPEGKQPDMIEADAIRALLEKA